MSMDRLGDWKDEWLILNCVYYLHSSNIIKYTLLFHSGQASPQAFS